MSPPADVSVVIPAFDCERTVGPCVESVLAGTVLPAEVIVVDDGSRDGTPAVVEALAARASVPVRLLRQPNRGPASARNAGARAATSEVVFFLDADTELEPVALERFVARLAEAEADAVCGVYHPEALNPGVVPAYKALFEAYNFSRNGVVEYDGFSGYCAGVRRAAFFAVGALDERLGATDQFELEEFGYRLSREHRTLIDPGIRARHHFPRLRALNRAYLRRVAQWTRLMRTRGRFERAGDATASNALFTVCGALFVGASLLAPVWPASWPLAALSGLAWAGGHAGFFAFVVRHDPARFPAVVALNLWFCLVIVAAAGWGLATPGARQASGARALDA